MTAHLEFARMDELKLIAGDILFIAAVAAAAAPLILLLECMLYGSARKKEAADVRVPPRKL